MINLKDALVNYITVGDQRFFLHTDYRYWIDYQDTLKNASEGNLEPLAGLFVDDIPPITEETISALNDFYYKPPEIPRMSENKGVELIDWKYDSDYIYAGFLQAYGIDLTESNLHWHKFVALLNALPDDTMMVKIMGYRGYNGRSKDPGHEEYVRLREMWALPKKRTAEEQKKYDEFNELFG